MTQFPLRDQIKLGIKVGIETKENQGTGKLTEGIVKNTLTSSNSHPHGIKVELEDGTVGRVKQILEKMSNPPKKDFDELEYQKYLEDVFHYRRHTTPQYDVESEPLSTKIIPKSDVPKYEDPYIEFKKTFQFDSKENDYRNTGKTEAADGRKKESKKIEKAIRKEISIAVSAFGNTMGGKLFIGVDDGGNVVGLDDDLKMCHDSFDEFLRAIQDSISTFTQNRVFLSEIIISIGEDNQFLQLTVPAFRYTPIFIKENDEDEFYIKGFGQSRKLSTSDAVSYIRRNFNQ